MKLIAGENYRCTECSTEFVANRNQGLQLCPKCRYTREHARAAKRRKKYEKPVQRRKLTQGRTGYPGYVMATLTKWTTDDKPLFAVTSLNVMHHKRIHKAE